MTEINENHLSPPLMEFVLHWGEMGQVWGVNRSVSQIHALLYVSAGPMTAEDIAGRLGLARSNVSTSLKQLLEWRLVKRVPVPGDRRDHFEAEADMLAMVRRIARARKAREIDPARDVLHRCAEAAARDRSVPAAVQARLSDMREVVDAVDQTFDAVMGLPSPLFRKLIRMGSAITRLLSSPAGRLTRRSSSSAP